MNTDKEIDLKLFAVAPGVWGMKDIFVNVYMIANSHDDSWVLVDAGLKWSAKKIKNMAWRLFGKHSKPSAIILTHGHFDHVGSVKQLAEEWEVPVYAHYMEMPFLTGKSSYPPPDPTVGGGLMTMMSWAYPKVPIDISDHLMPLPDDGSLPDLPQWSYIHTPGHTQGHISLFRKSDGVLIAGDAFVTTRAESAIATALQLKKLSGPPAYFTYDWQAAANSVQELMMLNPDVVATGHGQPMRGPSMRKALFSLCMNFEELALPSYGRYIHIPAVTNEEGIQSLPPRVQNPYSLPLKIAAAAVFVIGAYFVLRKRTVLKISNNTIDKSKLVSSPLRRMKSNGQHAYAS